MKISYLVFLSFVTLISCNSNKKSEQNHKNRLVVETVFFEVVVFEAKLYNNIPIEHHPAFGYKLVAHHKQADDSYEEVHIYVPDAVWHNIPQKMGTDVDVTMKFRPLDCQTGNIYAGLVVTQTSLEKET